MKYFFLTGAPRTGTTFVSDWITASQQGYCVHEVLPELRRLPVEERITALQGYAESGSDRLGKPLQKEFLAWNSIATKLAPAVLGLKNPWIWHDDAPEACLAELRSTILSRTIFLVRHPFDMIASGIVRGRKTRNWPNYSIAEHSNFFVQMLSFYLREQQRGAACLLIRYEDLLLEKERVRGQLESFLNITLPSFEGHEHQTDYFDRRKAGLCILRGITTNPDRELLTSADLEQIRTILGPSCNVLHYSLEDNERLTTSQ